MKKITPRETKSYNDWMEYIHECISKKNEENVHQLHALSYHRKLPIQDSWSNVILNFEHGSSNWGVTIAGYPLFIP